MTKRTERGVGIGLALGVGVWVGGFSPACSFPFLVAILGGCLGLCLIQRSQPEEPFLYNLFIGALAIRLLLCLYLFFHFSGPPSDGFFISDGWGYSYNGWWLAQMWHRGIYPSAAEMYKTISQSGHWSGYDTWNAYVYYVVGYSPLTLMFINCLIGSFAVLLVFWTAQLLAGIRPARIASLLTAFWPSLLLWSTQNLKDVWVVTALLLVVWSAVHFLIHRKIFILFWLGLGMWILVIFRFWALIPILIGFGVCFTVYGWQFLSTKCRRAFPNFRGAFVFFVLVFALLFGGLEKPVSDLVMWAFLISIFLFGRELSWNRRIQLGILLIVSLNIASFLPFLGETVQQHIALPFLSRFMDVPNLLSWLQKMREGTAVGRSSILPNADIASLPGLVAFLPLGLAYLLLAPFPWQLESTSHVLGIFQSFSMYLMIPFGIAGMIRLYRQVPSMRFLFFFFLSLMILMAVLEGNMGTLFRHKDMLFVFWFIYAGIGIGSERSPYVRNMRKT